MTANPHHNSEVASSGHHRIAFEFPSTDSGGRDTAALQAHERSDPLPVGVIRYHRFEHEQRCRIYLHRHCDCAVVMSVTDVRLPERTRRRGLLARIFGRTH